MKSNVPVAQVCAGGYRADPQPGSSSWGSTFAGWGGDCASAGTSTTCTLRLGKQRPTGGDGGQSGYSLEVTANFEAIPTGIGSSQAHPDTLGGPAGR